VDGIGNQGRHQLGALVLTVFNLRILLTHVRVNWFVGYTQFQAKLAALTGQPIEIVVGCSSGTSGIPYYNDNRWDKQVR
jgi:hypothetical protein